MGEQKRAQQARARGAASVDTAVVDGAFALFFGMLIGGWYTGWFEGKKSKPEQMVAWLRSREISVVVFELDGVMSRKQSGDGLLRYEMEEYFRTVSPEFVEAAALLASRGFGLAVACGPHQESTSSRTPQQPRSRWLGRGSSS